MRSLRARLVGLWCLSLLSSLVLGGLLLGLYRQSAEAQAGRSRAVLTRACDVLRDRYGLYVAGWAGPGATIDPALRLGLDAVLRLALERREGVAGGIWVPGSGSVAYADPDEEGAAPAAEPPGAVAGAVAAVNAEAAAAGRPAARRLASGSGTTVLLACPLPGPIRGATGWVMTRAGGTRGLRAVQAGLCALFALLLLTSLLLWRTMRNWRHQVRGIEAALGRDGEGGLPAVPRPGERELDRLVDALNRAGARLAEARHEAEALAGQVARAERLAGLGRVAAGVAHEIRNPIAAARLQGENALAGDDARRREAIGDMLEQLARLDGLVSELLAMTQRVQPAPVPVALAPFLRAVAARHAGSDLALGPDAEGTVVIDPAVVGRILDNLLGNALRHAGPGGRVRLSAERGEGLVTFSVRDDGPGVPEAMLGRLFEPFVTGRADGTGLGLAIARELADAHGGRLLLRDRGGSGALTDFALELPQ